MTPYLDVLGVDESARLAQRIRQGDRNAESQLVRSYCACVFAMPIARTHDRDAASELVDDVLMAVIAALRHGAVKDCAHLGGFVHGTTLNKINGYFRKRRHEMPTVPLDPDLPVPGQRDEFEVQDRYRTAQDAMALLDARDRQILYLSLSEGLKPGEIAARLGLSATLVRQRKCRALRAIVASVGEGSTGFRTRRLLRS